MPDEVKMSDNCYFIPLAETDEVWADAIVRHGFDKKGQKIAKRITATGTI